MVREPILGREDGAAFLARWLSGKRSVVLVTGRASYAGCGAESYLSPFLSGIEVTHLTTVGENARAEDVEEKRRSLPPRVDAYVAVGGGTAIDTAKLLRGVEGDLPLRTSTPSRRNGR